MVRSSAYSFEWAEIDWITSKVVHAPLLYMHYNWIAWYSGTMQSGAGKHTTFVNCIWSVINNILTLSADRTPSEL